MITEITNFLNIIIFENSWFFINYWSLLHVVFGAIVIYVLLSFLKRRSAIIALLPILIFWELIELSAIHYGSTFFRPEPMLDIIWDLIWGMIGGFIVLKVKKFVPNSSNASSCSSLQI